MGICGTAMGNTAIMLKRLGHTIYGADTGVYPPMSNVLADAGIAIVGGFNSKNLEDLAPDLVIVGNTISRGNPEIEWLPSRQSCPSLTLEFLSSVSYEDMETQNRIRAMYRAVYHYFSTVHHAGLYEMQ